MTNPRGFATTTTAYQAFDQPGMDAPLAIVHPEYGKGVRFIYPVG